MGRVDRTSKCQKRTSSQKSQFAVGVGAATVGVAISVFFTAVGRMVDSGTVEYPQ